MSDSKLSFTEKVLSKSELLYSAAQIKTALDAIALTMNERLEHTSPLVLCVMKGGIIFTGQMLTRLNCELELDYIHVTRYRNQTSGNQLEWLVYPDADLNGRVVVILDDILDEGITLKAIVEYCKSKGAKDVISAVLVHKVHDRCVDGIQSDYVALSVHDKYVFGYGMDYKGKLRHLNAIYAINE